MTKPKPAIPVVFFTWLAYSILDLTVPSHIACKEKDETVGFEHY
jgi:hypothetical protein